MTGAAEGGGPHVKVFNPAGATVFQFFAYGADFRGGVRVALGDVNGDGYDDIVTGAGPGGSPHVEVFSGCDGTLLKSFYAYGQNFTGGVYVAAGDVDGDGFADIITGAGAGGGPHVRVFDGASTTGTPAELVNGFYAFVDSVTAGVRVAAADLDDDGGAEIVAAMGPGQLGLVKFFNPEAPSTPVAGTPAAGFVAYDPEFKGGVSVAAYVDDEGPVIATGAGPGGGQHVRLFTPDGDEFEGVIPAPGTQGANVALGDISGDGEVQYLIANATASTHVRQYALGMDQEREFDAYPSVPLGTFVAIGFL